MTDKYMGNLTTEQQYLVKLAAERLKEEFTGTFGPETIERYIAESRDLLEPGATVTVWLPILIEKFTKDRLRALARVEGRTTAERPAVLFLCVQNAGRSQMAAGWLQHLTGNDVDVFSGGSEPASEINGMAVQAMAEAGIDIRTAFPKPWTDEIVRAADVVITMGCGDACPVYPGKRYEDWELTDPKDQPIEVVREVRDDIEQRVRELIASLEVPAAL
jgi:protein-tyrosine-phosphatase